MDAAALFQNLVAGNHPPGGYDWRTLMTSLDELSQHRGEAAERLVRGLLEFDGEIPLCDASEAPHSMSPEDYLTSHAIQVLAEWNREQHRDAIARAADETDSELLREVARHHLQR